MSILIEVLLLGKSPQIMLETQQQMIRSPGSIFAFKGFEEGGGRLRCEGKLFLFVRLPIYPSFLSLIACRPWFCTLPRQAIAPPRSSTPSPNSVGCSFYVCCNLDRLCCSRLVAGWPYRSNKHCRQFHIDQFNLYGEILPNQGSLFVALC
jgi:hypothetical protein